MWILSQNREEIFNAINIIQFNVYNGNIFATYGECEDSFQSIGKYSVERIQEVFNALIDAIAHPNDYGNKFEMPEE